MTRRKDKRQIALPLAGAAPAGKPVTGLSSGRAGRDVALARVEGANEAWVARARQAMSALAAQRGGTVSSDDVWAWAERVQSFPGSGKAVGAVFNAKAWEPVGWKSTSRASSHARPIRVWVPRQEVACG